jgi:putative membrane protein
MPENPGWADRLLSEGKAPDPRFSLANERTFLAWIRTALGMVAAGVALAVSGHLVSVPARVVLSAGFCAIGALFAFLAFGRWLRTERALRKEEPLPLPTLAPVLSYGLAIGAIALLVVLLATR